MEQNPAGVGLQPLLEAGYSVTFHITEQQSEGDKMRTRGLPGACPFSFRLTWRTQPGAAGGQIVGTRVACDPRDKDTVGARGQSRCYPGPNMAQGTRVTRLDPKYRISKGPHPHRGPVYGFSS